MPASSQLSLSPCAMGASVVSRAGTEVQGRAVKERVMSRSVTPRTRRSFQSFIGEGLDKRDFFALLALSDDVTHGLLLTDVRAQFQ